MKRASQTQHLWKQGQLLKSIQWNSTHEAPEQWDRKQSKHWVGTKQLNGTATEVELACLVDHELCTWQCDTISAKASWLSVCYVLSIIFIWETGFFTCCAQVSSSGYDQMQTDLQGGRKMTGSISLKCIWFEVERIKEVDFAEKGEKTIQAYELFVIKMIVRKCSACSLVLWHEIISPSVQQRFKADVKRPIWFWSVEV